MNLFFFSVMDCDIGVFLKNHHHQILGQKFAPMFSLRNFTVLHFISRSMVHFGFIFEKCVGSCLGLMFWQIDVQSSHHHLLKRLSFLCWIAMAPMSRTIFLLTMLFFPLSQFSCSIFCYIDFGSISLLMPYCLDYCSFINSQWN